MSQPLVSLRALAQDLPSFGMFTLFGGLILTVAGCAVQMTGLR